MALPMPRELMGAASLDYIRRYIDTHINNLRDGIARLQEDIDAAVYSVEQDMARYPNLSDIYSFLNESFSQAKSILDQVSGVAATLSPDNIIQDPATYQSYLETMDEAIREAYRILSKENVKEAIEALEQDEEIPPESYEIYQWLLREEFLTKWREVFRGLRGLEKAMGVLGERAERRAMTEEIRKKEEELDPETQRSLADTLDSLAELADTTGETLQNLTQLLMQEDPHLIQYDLREGIGALTSLDDDLRLFGKTLREFLERGPEAGLSITQLLDFLQRTKEGLRRSLDELQHPLRNLYFQIKQHPRSVELSEMLPIAQLNRQLDTVMTAIESLIDLFGRRTGTPADIEGELPPT